MILSIVKMDNKLGILFKLKESVQCSRCCNIQLYKLTKTSQLDNNSLDWILIPPESINA